MKKQSFLFIIFLGALSSLLLNSCKGEDRRDEYKSVTDVNNWIYSQMSANYLWNATLPSRDKVNFYTEPTPFFTSLLSSNEFKNGRYYSYIKEKTVTTKAIDEASSYGYEFMLYKISNGIVGRVIYVLPNSPAEVAGLKRGDWFGLVNDKSITENNTNILLTGEGIKLTIVRLETTNGNPNFVKGDNITIGAAKAVNNNPVLVKKILKSSTNKTVGYLMYTHFAAGIENIDKDISYETSLKKAFAEFKNSGVNEFVLDLRYNPGGLITNSQLLSTMLAPESAFGKVFCKIRRNNNTNDFDKLETTSLDPQLIGEGANLNLKRLFVLVSDHTASASELVINGLNPFMQVVLIGKKTEGKNLCSVKIEDAKYNWILQPIIGQLYNSLNFTDYANGFIPNVAIDEMESLDTFLPLGDANELMLKKALSFIDGEAIPPLVNKTKATTSRVIGSSLDRKRSNGAWLNTVTTK